MAIRSMHVRANPLGSCPVPPPSPPSVRLHHDPAHAATVQRVYVRLLVNYEPAQVTGTYRESTKTANIDVGPGKWSELSNWLGNQPFVVTINTVTGSTSGLEDVNDFECLPPSGTLPG